MTNEPIREFLIHHVEAHPTDIAAVAAKQFGITRQGVNRHLRNLVSEGILSAEGATRHRQYKLVTQEVRTTIALSPGLQEHQLWDEVAAPMLKTLRENVRTICMHGFTEMVNNALE